MLERERMAAGHIQARCGGGDDVERGVICARWSAGMHKVLPRKGSTYWRDSGLDLDDELPI